MRIVAFALACVLIGGVATGVRAASLTPRPALVQDGTITNVTKLPGWPGDLPSELYAGFVTVPDPALPPNTTMKMHYLFYGKEGGDDGESPVIVWYSGGPGAPSCWGTFTENGPWLLNEQSFITNYDPATGTPGLIANPFAWTKLGPLLAFDNPPPTGFSDCSPPGPTGTGYACGTWNDTRVGYVNAYAIGEVLANQFPGLLDNPNRPVYIIGESYGGVYITETVHAIASATGVDNLVRVGAHIAGVGLGDACMGTDQICGNTAEAGPGRWLEWMYGHGQYPKEMFLEMQQLCTEQELRWGVVSNECDAIVDKINTAIGGYYVYNLYDDCPSNEFGAVGQLLSRRTHSRPKSQRAFNAKALARPLQQQRQPARAVQTADSPAVHMNGYWCPGFVFSQYMNLSSVRSAIGVPLDANFFIEDDAVGMPYNLTLRDGFRYWAALLRNQTVDGGNSTITRPFRLMSYNGDADAAVIQAETEPVWYDFAKNYSYSKSSEWRSWISEAPGIVGGYVVEWLDGRVSYATVRGSGHMVPEYRARAALALIGAFVHGDAPAKP
jgi:serine carboxypeptidase-like clade 1